MWLDILSKLANQKSPLSIFLVSSAFSNKFLRRENFVEIWSQEVFKTLNFENL